MYNFKGPFAKIMACKDEEEKKKLIKEWIDGLNGAKCEPVENHDISKYEKPVSREEYRKCLAEAAKVVDDIQKDIIMTDKSKALDCVMAHVMLAEKMYFIDSTPPFMPGHGIENPEKKDSDFFKSDNGSNTWLFMLFFFAFCGCNPKSADYLRGKYDQLKEMLEREENGGE